MDGLVGMDERKKVEPISSVEKETEQKQWAVVLEGEKLADYERSFSSMDNLEIIEE